MQEKVSFRTDGKTVLLADDDPTVRSLTRTILEMSGYLVIEAEDGEDAVQKFMTHRDRIVLLVLDVVMPKKNGKETYAEIRKMNPGIKVLFISGYTYDIIRRDGIIEDGLSLVSKPFSSNELLSTVQSLVN
ncbi:MAG: response regulator [bacterium]